MNLNRYYNDSLALWEGRGTQKDERRAFELNREAALGGHSDAILAMGWYYLNGVGIQRSVSDAIVWYRRSARKGEPRAMFSLGYIAYSQRDWNGAKTWLKRAADLGHHRSFFWLGKLYWRGHAVEQSRKEAMKLFHLAARQKVPEATRTLKWLSALSNHLKKTSQS